jgi:hypothetical protein
MFDEHGASLVSVTQQLHTTDSLGRLTLNILLSFAELSENSLAGIHPSSSAIGTGGGCADSASSFAGENSNRKTQECP